MRTVFQSSQYTVYLRSATVDCVDGDVPSDRPRRQIIDEHTHREQDRGPRKGSERELEESDAAGRLDLEASFFIIVIFF